MVDAIGPINIKTLKTGGQMPAPARPAGGEKAAPVSDTRFARKPKPVISSITVMVDNKPVKSVPERTVVEISISGKNLPAEKISLTVTNLKNVKIKSAAGDKIIIEAETGDLDRVTYRRLKLMVEGKVAAEKTFPLRLKMRGLGDQP